MSTSVTLKASGLNTSPNELTVPEGALFEASNVIIRRENVVEPRRGFNLYGNSFGTASDRAKQLISYKDRILRHFQSTLQYDNGSGVFTSFSGSFTEPATGVRIKSVESNGNLYFTTSDGVKKISAASASDFTPAAGYITNAGGIKAVDFTVALNIQPTIASPWFLNDSTVAYRVVWGIKDANENVILGAPSQREVIYNDFAPVIVRDFLRVLGVLDNLNVVGSLITDGDYVSTLALPLAATAGEIRTNLIALATKLDNDIVYSPGALTVNGAGSSGSGTVYTVAFSAGTVTDYIAIGDSIELTGFTPSALNGIHTVTGVTGTTLSFASAETGVITVAGTIKSNNYRAITTPGAVDIPATHAQLQDLQDYLSDIVVRLQLEPTGVIPPSVAPQVEALTLTSGYTTLLNITIPDDVTPQHFFQVYRSDVLTATGTDVLSDLTPSDELKLVYEANPTAADITAGSVSFEDITPEAFAGANLYTNPASGEGISQANDLPPFALDINVFKNVVFYANTRTRHRAFLNLLGVTNMIDQDGMQPNKVTITDGTVSNTYTFTLGVQEVTQVVCGAQANISTGGRFYLNSANDFREYFVWFDKTGSDPVPSEPGKVSLRVDVNGLTTATEIAERLRDTLNLYPDDFSATSLGSTVTITNVDFGMATDASIVTGLAAPFAITTTTQGDGEDAANNKVLLDNSVSVATAVDNTARSFVRVVNKNTNEIVNAFYLSGSTDVPGQILFELKDLDADPFYILAENSVTGASFSPDISPSLNITSITTGAPGVMTVVTAEPHGLAVNDNIIVSGTNSTPSLDGGQTVTAIVDANTFRVNVTVTIAGTEGGIDLASEAETSENEAKGNRIYYSKVSQPEAVPILNYLDVGAKDRSILRIFPIRDSLFVFKQDGLYRISGELAPWNLALFDTSAELKASDSLAVANNLIFGWFTQGICSVSETGVSIISRPIDNQILRLSSASFTNFASATVGVGYDSDNAYLAFTIDDVTDTLSTLCYRYNTLTNSWSTFDFGANCGIVHRTDDKLYYGPVDTNFIAKERKDFLRTDYADRQFNFAIGSNSYSGTNIKLSNTDNIGVGDAIVQEQTVSMYQYHALLLKLDIDPILTDNDYNSSLEAVNGDAMWTKLDQVIAKVRDDAGRQATAGHTADASYTALIPTSQTFTALQTNFNALTALLNADLGVGWNNYAILSGTTTFETDVTAVNKSTDNVTIRNALQFVQGPFVVYKRIATRFRYAPNQFGDPVSYKQIREATVMFANKAFTSASVSFATDLLPELEKVEFLGDGNGAFGISNPFGNNFFGGASHSAPFRTYVPLRKQRCRYMTLQFEHGVARESYLMLGVSLTGRTGISSRAYR